MPSPEFVIQGLVSRGLPLPVAQGFAGNMAVESGFNPGINEIAPLVPGSRGGFGLYQLTGPRRTQYEQFAADRGVNPADPDAQLDFLMWELGNTEAKAGQALQGVTDPVQAAQIVSERFLRPGIPHMDRRLEETRRLAGIGGAPMQRMSQGEQPQQPQAAPDTQQPFLRSDRGQDFLDRLVVGLEGMTLNPNQALMQAAQARIGERRERAQTTQQRNRTADWLESQGMTGVASGLRSGALSVRDAFAMAQGQGPTKGVEINGRLVNPFTGEVIADLSDGGEMESAVRALKQRAAEAGLSPGSDAYREFMLRGGAASGMALSVGPDGSVIFKTGDMASREQEQNKSIAQADQMLASIDAALNDPALGKAVGVTGAVTQFTGPLSPDAARARSRIDQLQGQAFLQAYESLKGGGQITEVEGKKAEAAIARLNRDQSVEDFKAALRELRNVVEAARLRLTSPSSSGGTVANGGDDFPVMDRID